MSSRLPSRIAWLAKEIIPHEPDLRRWLRGRISASTIDDVVQESYAILGPSHGRTHSNAPHLSFQRRKIGDVEGGAECSGR